MIVTWVAIGLGVVVLAVVAAVGYTAVALPGCDSCHLKGDFATDTASSPHADVACADCHVEMTVPGRISFAAREVFHMVVPLVGDLDRSYAAVPADRCASCHPETAQAGIVGTRGLRMQHVTCIGDFTCTDCHSLTAHGASTSWPRVAQMEDCYSCHGQTNEVVACDSCHAEREERQRIFDGPFRVTHGAEWESTHGMGEMRSCSACHTQDKCASCHGVGVPHSGNFLDLHAGFSTSPEARCTTCHREEFCSDCHAYPMPHTAEWVLGHGDLVEDDGEGGCLTCHEKADCTDCHESHVHPVTQEQMDAFDIPGGDSR
jgi:hypothetical protein